ncbi:nodulation protein NfeD [Bacillus sp. FJAT-47783]|uniref:NfeD family protein n=1 Tax=Bacillus sp. FJAT-47783 TaxID=2922712 RepID=UPI001FABB870|nr:nodulation protein NfeD [Bacillus sp. FJAT-47783]
MIWLGGSQPLRADNNKVYVIPIEETVEKGLSAFIERSIKEAETEGATKIIFELNTPGGAVDAAVEIAKHINSTKIDTVAYVNKQAISAGAYIALNTDEIYFHPSGTMGSAAIIDLEGNAADKKAASFWKAEMINAAEAHQLDPIYAEAMVDANVDLPQVGAAKGDLLTLTAKQAVEVGYAKGIVSSLNDLLEELALQDATVVQSNVSFAEKVARFLTHPVVVPILLSIGSIGLILELYTPGFGIPGFMGLSSLLLFFYGHQVAGLAGMESFILFIGGILLIIVEFFIPGGIAGLLGAVAIIISLFFASGDISQMAISLVIAVVAAVSIFILMTKVFGKRMKFFRKIVLSDQTTTEKGYVSNASRTELLGQVGMALTTLRPAGTALFGDERLDVVTEGGYIEKGKKVKVIKTEGSRIVVRELNE